MADEWHTPYLLGSATDDITSLPIKYQHVNALYKYGCGACDAKEKNRWFNICDACKDNAKTDQEIKNQAQKVIADIDKRFEMESPPPGLEPDDDLRCDFCEVIYHELKELKDHYKIAHPDKDVKYKRGKQIQSNDAGKRGKR